MIARDHPTGEMLWYNRVRPPDLFNLDFQISPMRARVKIDGSERNIVIGSGKLGISYTLTANLPSPYNATAYQAETPAQALNRSEGGTAYGNGNAGMYAVDAGIGEVLWSYTFDRIAFGGATVVKDLVFTATLDGRLYALSRADGSMVWQWRRPAGQMPRWQLPAIRSSGRSGWETRRWSLH